MQVDSPTESSALLLLLLLLLFEIAVGLKMGCGTSNDVMPKDNSGDNEKPEIPQSPNLKTNYSIAFEVPFHDLETVGKKPLPQKLQRLQEQQTPEPEETMKMLQKRLADADQRRQQILSVRVNSAQQFNLKNRTAS